MPYQVISQEQFKKLRDNGYSVEKIAEFEKKRMAEEGGTAVMEEPQPKESPLREAYREGLGQAAHGVSQIAFGLPEFAAQKISPRFKEAVFPEPRTSTGKTFRAATDIYSMFGGGAAKLAGKTAMAGIKGGVKELAKKGLAEKTGRLAASGAVYGGTQLEPESTVGGQALKAAGGATAGIGLTLAGAGVVKTGQNINKIGKFFKVLKGPNQAQIKSNISNIKSEIDVLQATTKQAKLNISSQELAERKFLNDTINNAKVIFRENNENLLNQLNKASETGTINTRNLLREMNSAASQTYGTALNSMDDYLIQSGNNMTKQEFLEMYVNTLNKAQEGALPVSKIENSLRNMANKFGVSYKENNWVIDDPNGLINFKEFISDVKNLRKGLSGSFRQGTGATSDDVVFDMFQDEYGKWVANRVPEFSKLQAEYAPIAELKRQANRIFKPYDIGEYKTSQGARMLKNFGLTKEGEKEGEKRLLKAIEKGFELQGKKIGGKKGIYKDIESLGQQFRDLAEQKIYITEALNKKISTMTFTNKSERLAVEKEFSKRINELTARKLTESIALKNRADADRLGKWLVGAGLGAAGFKMGIPRLTEH